MAVYIDPLVEYETDQIKPAARKFGNKWCHMIADSPEELHKFASDIGLRVEWAQKGKREALLHYDLNPSKRVRAVSRGAQEVTHAQFRALMASRVGAEVAAEITDTRTQVG